MKSTLKSTPSKKFLKIAGRRGLQACLAVSGLLAGCSSGTPPPAAPLPPPPAPSNATAYVGTQAPGLWTLSVDTTQNLFSYQSQAVGAAAVSGGLLTRNGVLDLGSAASVSLGRAVAQPAGGAMLRPGGEATYPIAMVQQSGCVPITGKLRYIYAPVYDHTLHEGEGVSNPGYGTFTVSTSTDGKSWSFGDVHNYVLTSFQGGPYAAGTENGSDPAFFSATCATTGTLGVVTASANAAFPVDATTNAPSLPSLHFNPAGAFVEDRGNGTSWVGFAEPQAAVKASDVGAGTYRGFVVEGTTSAPIDTRTVAFETPSSGTATLTGGVFPNEDLSTIPLQEYTITLGTQDPTLNGVFPSATFTAQDVKGYCAHTAGSDAAVRVSFDANGNEVCTALGVAVVGQVGGKYVAYFTSRDATKQVGSDGTTGAEKPYVIQFFLYQQ